VLSAEFRHAKGVSPRPGTLRRCRVSPRCSRWQRSRASGGSGRYRHVRRRDFTLQGWVKTTFATTASGYNPVAVRAGNGHEYIPFAGQSVGLIADVLPVAQIVRRTIEQAENTLDTPRSFRSSAVS
jgi:hypothetical protein